MIVSKALTERKMVFSILILAWDEGMLGMWYHTGDTMTFSLCPK
jgi:hypothetical protein